MISFATIPVRPSAERAFGHPKRASERGTDFRVYQYLWKSFHLAAISVLDIAASNFRFVSDFRFRPSDFELAPFGPGLDTLRRIVDFPVGGTANRGLGISNQFKACRLESLRYGRLESLPYDRSA
jgi:hypothetical protein